MVDGLREVDTTHEEDLGRGECASDGEHSNASLMLPNVPLADMNEVDIFNWLLAVGNDPRKTFRDTAEAIVRDLNFVDAVAFIQKVDSVASYMGNLFGRFSQEALENSDGTHDPVGATVGSFRDRMNRTLEEEIELEAQGVDVQKIDVRVHEGLLTFSEAFLKGLPNESGYLQSVYGAARSMYGALSTVYYKTVGGPEL